MQGLMILHETVCKIGPRQTWLTDGQT